MFFRLCSAGFLFLALHAALPSSSRAEVPEVGCKSAITQSIAAPASGRKTEKRTIVFLGPPAALKGTIAHRFMTEYAVRSISVGDEIRRQKNEKTPLGLEAIEYQRKGKLVPSSILQQMVDPLVASVSADLGLIPDGIPRRLDQVEVLEKALKASGRQVDLVVVFDLDLPTSIDRIQGRWVCPQCQRSYHVRYQQPAREGFCDDCTDVKLAEREDSSLQAIQGRWTSYEVETRPVIRYFESLGLVRHLDARKNRDELWQDFLRIIEK